MLLKKVLIAAIVAAVSIVSANAQQVLQTFTKALVKENIAAVGGTALEEQNIQYGRYLQNAIPFKKDDFWYAAVFLDCQGFDCYSLAIAFMNPPVQGQRFTLEGTNTFNGLNPEVKAAVGSNGVLLLSRTMRSKGGVTRERIAEEFRLFMQAPHDFVTFALSPGSRAIISSGDAATPSNFGQDGAPRALGDVFQEVAAFPIDFGKIETPVPQDETP